MPPCMDYAHLHDMAPAVKRFSRFFGRFLWVSGRVSCPRGPTLESVFLWRCFCRQKPPCSGPSDSLWEIFLDCLRPKSAQKRPRSPDRGKVAHGVIGQVGIPHSSLPVAAERQTAWSLARDCFLIEYFMVTPLSEDLPGPSFCRFPMVFDRFQGLCFSVGCSCVQKLRCIQFAGQTFPRDIGHARNLVHTTLAISLRAKLYPAVLEDVFLFCYWSPLRRGVPGEDAADIFL
jgi:hypothetical protein